MPYNEKQNYRTHSERKTLRITVRSILLIQHVVERRDLPVLVGNLSFGRSILGTNQAW